MTKRRNRQKKEGKITLLRHANSASCLGIISNAGARLGGDWREGDKGATDTAGNVHCHTILLGQTWDDEPQFLGTRRK